MHTFKSLR